MAVIEDGTVVGVVLACEAVCTVPEGEVPELSVPELTVGEIGAEPEEQLSSAMTKASASLEAVFFIALKSFQAKFMTRVTTN